MADRTVITEEQENKNGEVRIANDVISVIAGMALCELPGVYIDGRLPEAFIDKSNAKNITKSIKVEVNNGEVSITITISVEYGKIISELCAAVQEKIKTAIQTMTGLYVSTVSVTVADLIIRKEGKGDTKK